MLMDETHTHLYVTEGIHHLVSDFFGYIVCSKWRYIYIITLTHLHVIEGIFLQVWESEFPGHMVGGDDVGDVYLSLQCLFTNPSQVIHLKTSGQVKYLQTG